jgi:capsular exopolysaccharide synthesis family protein
MNATEPVSLRHVLRVLRRRKWTVLQAVVIVTAAAVVVTLRAPSEYSASATLLVGRAESAALGGLESEQELSVLTAAKLVRTRTVAERVRSELESERTAGELLASVETLADEDEALVTVTARAGDAVEAARIADAFAVEFVEAREEGADERLEAIVGALEEQIALLAEGSPEREALATELSHLRARAALPSAEVTVVERAEPSTESTGTKPIREGLVGLGLGLVLGLGLAFLREALDPRVKTVEELGRLVPAPQLASVPASIFRRGVLRRLRRRPRIVREVKRHAEPFEGLRASLLFFNSERDVRSLVVTSPGEGEGKTTVASNLGVALAKLGLRVCVVDADLRRPRIARHFGLDPAVPGLTDLIGGAPLPSVIQEFHVPGAAAANGNGAAPSGANRLSVIASGRATTAPAELLEGHEMAHVLERLEREFDAVVIDSPPILRASDPLPLMARASGTLLVVRFFHTPRDAVSRALGIVERVGGGGLLGVVGTGLPASELRREGAGPYLASPPPAPHVS